MTCDICGSKLRAIVLSSDDEGPQEVEYACPNHGPQWRYQYHKWERVEPGKAA